jgi:hypothetical protein
MNHFVAGAMSRLDPLPIETTQELREHFNFINVRP